MPVYRVGVNTYVVRTQHTKSSNASGGAANTANLTLGYFRGIATKQVTTRPKFFIYEAAAGGTTFFQDLILGVTVTPGLLKQTNKTITLAVTVTAALVKSVLKTLSRTFTVTPVLVKQVNHIFADLVVTVTPALVKQVNHIFANLTVTVTPVLVAMKVFLKTLAVGITVTPALVRQVGKTLAVGIVATPVLVKRVNKTIALGVTVTVGLVKRVNKTIALGVTITVALVKQQIVTILKTLAVNFTVTPVLSAVAAVRAAVEIAKRRLGSSQDPHRLDSRPVWYLGRRRRRP